MKMLTPSHDRLGDGEYVASALDCQPVKSQVRLGTTGSTQTEKALALDTPIPNSSAKAKRNLPLGKTFVGKRDDNGIVEIVHEFLIAVCGLQRSQVFQD